MLLEKFFLLSRPRKNFQKVHNINAANAEINVQCTTSPYPENSKN